MGSWVQFAWVQFASRSSVGLLVLPVVWTALSPSLQSEAVHVVERRVWQQSRLMCLLEMNVRPFVV
jgi:hypothetical protein